MFKQPKGQRGVVVAGTKNKQGQVVTTGATGNRGGHNVEDNDFIFDIPLSSEGAVKPRKDVVDKPN